MGVGASVAPAEPTLVLMAVPFASPATGEDGLASAPVAAALATSADILLVFCARVSELRRLCGSARGFRRATREKADLVWWRRLTSEKLEGGE